MRLDLDYCNDVNDWLTTGGDLYLAYDLTGNTAIETIRDLVDRGVTHVLDLRSEWEDADEWAQGAPAVRYLHAPIVDDRSYFIGGSWYKAVEGFVHEFLENRKPGDRLYAHCHMGVNRGPTAAMIALLAENPDLDPYQVFLAIRAARPVCGIVYAEQVGARHLRKFGKPVDGFKRAMKSYWTAERIREVKRGVAYYRTKEGTLVVDNT